MAAHNLKNNARNCKWRERKVYFFYWGFIFILVQYIEHIRQINGFVNVKKEKFRGQPDLNRWPLDLQSNALPLSYTPIRNNERNWISKNRNSGIFWNGTSCCLVTSSGYFHHGRFHVNSVIWIDLLNFKEISGLRCSSFHHNSYIVRKKSRCPHTSICNLVSLVISTHKC